jgi:GTP cyclohydrolase I
MVIMRDIEFTACASTTCCRSSARASPTPAGKVIGLSDPRIVDLFARRAGAGAHGAPDRGFIEGGAPPHGWGRRREPAPVRHDAQVKKANARMVTSAMCGAFKENQSTRQEFLDLIGRASPASPL